MVAHKHPSRDLTPSSQCLQTATVHLHTINKHLLKTAKKLLKKSKKKKTKKNWRVAVTIRGHRVAPLSKCLIARLKCLTTVLKVSNHFLQKVKIKLKIKNKKENN